jgi:hypothetical protein
MVVVVVVVVMMMTVEYSALFIYGDQPARCTEALKMSASSVHYRHLQRHGVARTHLCICSRANGTSNKANKVNKTSVHLLCFPKTYESYRHTNT